MSDNDFATALGNDDCTRSKPLPHEILERVVNLERLAEALVSREARLPHFAIADADFRDCLLEERP